MIEWQKIAEWSFMGLLSGGLGLLIKTLLEIRNDVKNISVTIARLSEKDHWHEEAIKEGGLRIEKLEDRMDRWRDGNPSTKGKRH